MRRSDEELAAAGMLGYEDYTTTNAEDKPRLENYHVRNHNTPVKYSKDAPSKAAKTSMTVLRWILFLPAAFSAAILAQLIVSIEQLFLAVWIVELSIKFFMGLAFVAVGARVAPTSRLWPATVLLVFQAGGALSGIANTWADGSGKIWWEMVLYLAVIAGAAVGFFWARRDTEGEGSSVAAFDNTDPKAMKQEKIMKEMILVTCELHETIMRENDYEMTEEVVNSCIAICNEVYEILKDCTDEQKQKLVESTKLQDNGIISCFVNNIIDIVSRCSWLCNESRPTCEWILGHSKGESQVQKVMFACLKNMATDCMCNHLLAEARNST